ncbi:DNA-binding protein [Lactiplantibacillus plantarum]|nr:DNA-binding protein [Lactiplantibacillus plantarum]MCT3272008.1 DNA-binding protein [Lactiplantibacillus plantarum]
MTYKQAMDCLNIKSYNTLYKYIKQGLRVVAINGTKRIDQLDADKFMEAHKI